MAQTWRARGTNKKDRISIDASGIVDEFVVDQWFQLEHMDHDRYFIRVGDCRMHVTLRQRKVASLQIEDDADSNQ